jgi:DMSO/TMAO reductase YedYZ molybdopterin-dependent catalytic subunit
VLAANLGSSVGGPLRPLALLSPRRGVVDDGPTGFPVNKTARTARVTPAMVAPASYALELRGGTRDVELTREQLLGMPLRTARLPIACVEGWSTTQEWTGVPLADLARMAGADGAREVRVESLQPAGILRQATLSGDQVAAHDALLALRVNGVDLSMDHGFPARIIVPALPGVHNTKWVARMTFAT